MDPFTNLHARAAALAKANIDTEVIIPITRLIEFPRGQLGPYAFEPWRYTAEGDLDPDFALNAPQFAGARILVTGENFGCGSSREHAVWALWDMGFRCIIAPSFGDIFRSNCYQNGMLPIVLDKTITEKMISDLWAQSSPSLTVNLQSCEVIDALGRSIPFAIEPERRAALIEGLDEIGLTLKLITDIAQFQRRDLEARPWVYQKMRAQNV